MDGSGGGVGSSRNHRSRSSRVVVPTGQLDFRAGGAGRGAGGAGRGAGGVRRGAGGGEAGTAAKAYAARTGLRPTRETALDRGTGRGRPPRPAPPGRFIDYPRWGRQGWTRWLPSWRLLFGSIGLGIG